MTGLLVKDIRLLLGQKRVFATLMLFVLLFLLTGTFSGTFVVGYAMLLFVLLVGNTVSHDEMDNGYAFLFTLPFERWEYVAEKYLLGLIMGAVAVCVSSGFTAVSGIVLHSGIDLAEHLWTLAGVLLSGQLFVWITLPVQLGLGTEKSRYVLLAASLLIAGVLLSRDWLAEHIGRHLTALFTVLAAHKAATIAILLALAAALLACSVAASMQILRRKEF